MINTDMILESLSMIDQTTDSSEINVLCSLSASYSKACSILLEHAEDEDVDSFGIFQEGDILDEATGRGKLDNIFMKVIKFIPRLFIAIGRRLTAGFKKENAKLIMVEGDKYINNVKQMNEQELTKEQARVNHMLEENAKYNASKQELTFTGKLGAGVKNLRNKADLIKGIDKIVTRFKVENTEESFSAYDKLGNELKMLKGKHKNLDGETVTTGISALLQAISDVGTTCGVSGGVLNEYGDFMQKKISEDVKNGKIKTATQKQRMVDLSNTLKDISLIVNDTCSFVDTLKGISKKVVPGLSALDIKTDRSAKRQVKKNRKNYVNGKSDFGGIDFPG